MSKKARPRTQARQAERAAQKLVRERERLAELEPGGTPARPIEVESAAVVEVQALGAPCIQCGGSMRLEEHAAEGHAGQLLRVVRMRCPSCGTRRVRWFRVSPPRLN